MLFADLVLSVLGVNPDPVAALAGLLSVLSEAVPGAGAAWALVVELLLAAVPWAGALAGASGLRRRWRRRPEIRCARLINHHPRLDVLSLLPTASLIWTRRSVVIG